MLRAMLPDSDLVEAVRKVLARERYLSASQILEQLPMREQLLRDCGSSSQAVRRVKDALLKSLHGELSFDFTPNGKSYDVLGSEVVEVSMVFKLRG
jgi:hypothetical protein